MSQKIENNWGSQIIWVLFFLVIIAGIFYFKRYKKNNTKSHQNITQNNDNHGNKPNQNIILDNNSIDYLPIGTNKEVVKHKGFTLSYSEPYEQAEWVAYLLTREMVVGYHAPRNDNFRPDFSVKTYSATPDDYRGSGYDRGHLCPASDMSYDEKAMDETFLMSNMSPQVRNFNGGIWRELEENVKDWARKHQKIYVVTGPILKPGLRFIGKTNKVSIPEAYYKVILDANLQDAIAFIMPNEVSEKPIKDYATTIDEVEKITNINFFPKLLTPDQEVIIESKFNSNNWSVNEKRYQTRLREWNHR